VPFGSDEMVTRARAWLDANAAQFRVPLDAGPQPFVRGVKMVAERAQLGDLLGFAPWIDDGWRELGEGAHLVHAMTLHPGLALMAPAYVPFHRRGHASAAVLDFVRATAARIADFPPPRRFYIAWAAEALELPCETSFEAAVHDAPLGRRPPPHALTTEDAYAITHAVFYATDWGRRSAELPGRRSAELPGRRSAELPAEYLAEVLEAWWPRCARAGNFDLLAELVMAARCVAAPCPREEIWRALVAAQEADGALPEPTGNVSRHLGTGSRDRMRALTHYHPTIVALSAGAMWQA